MQRQTEPVLSRLHTNLKKCYTFLKEKDLLFEALTRIRHKYVQWLLSYSSLPLFFIMSRRIVWRVATSMKVILSGNIAQSIHERYTCEKTWRTILRKSLHGKTYWSTTIKIISLIDFKSKSMFHRLIHVFPCVYLIMHVDTHLKVVLLFHWTTIHTSYIVTFH